VTDRRRRRGSPTAPGRSTTTPQPRRSCRRCAAVGDAGQAISGVEGTTTPLATIAALHRLRPGRRRGGLRRDDLLGRRPVFARTIARRAPASSCRGGHTYAEEGAFVANLSHRHLRRSIGRRASLPRRVWPSPSPTPRSARARPRHRSRRSRCDPSGVVVGTSSMPIRRRAGRLRRERSTGRRHGLGGRHLAARGRGTALAVRGTHAYLEEGFSRHRHGRRHRRTAPAAGTRSVVAWSRGQRRDAPLLGAPAPAAIADERKGRIVANATVATFTDADPGAAAGELVARRLGRPGRPGSPDITPGGVSGRGRHEPHRLAVSVPPPTPRRGVTRSRSRSPTMTTMLGTAPGGTRATLVGPARRSS